MPSTPTRQLHDLGQRLWVDNISRGMLNKGSLARYIADWSVTGLTSNPTIFEKAISESKDYDDSIARLAALGMPVESLLSALVMSDLRTAADLLRPTWDESRGVDGWVSLEVSPLLAHDSTGTTRAAVRLYQAAERPNFFIKIPGTHAGVDAIEQSVFNGVPINVTLLFSTEQYLAAAEAYLRGVERRLMAGLDADVASVASLFVSRWDVAVKGKVPAELNNRLGIAMATRTYMAYRDLLASLRWRRLEEAGARPQRLLWASTGTKDPAAPETLYVDALAAPDTINTLPEKTLRAFAEGGSPGAPLAADDDDDAEAVLADVERAGVNLQALAGRLQRDGVEAFAKSWHALLACIEDKSKALARTPA